MENQRLILFLLLSFTVLLLWQAWQQDYGPAQSVAKNAANSTPTTTPSPPVAAKDVPVSAPSAAVAPQIAAAPKGVAAPGAGQRIKIETDVLRFEIDTQGANIQRGWLLKYPTSLENKDDPYPLMGDTEAIFHVAQSGLLANAPAPDHHALYQTEQREYKLQAGQDSLSVAFAWQSPAGVTVKKIYTMRRDSYIVQLDYQVMNSSPNDWRGRLYGQFQRTDYSEPGKTQFVYSYSGGVVSTPEKPYEKIAFSDMAKYQPPAGSGKGGWVAMLQHYFIAAWLPPKDQIHGVFARTLEGGYHILGITGAETLVPAGAQGTLTTSMYIGPKEQKRLAAAAENLPLTVDYGWLTLVADPIYLLMEFIYRWVGNWGWTIILLTLTVKLAFYKLSESAYRSMAKMKKIAPKFQALRERYGDDKQRYTQAIMELYKKEKANPMSGCWPHLIQVPVFIALYWVLMESVEMRQAPFIFWLQDLSVKDPFYVLPIAYGAITFLQQKLNPSPGMDPIQQKVLMYMPLIFVAFMAFFPAGLMVYFIVNSVTSIAQQLYIYRKYANA
ncbi:MAG: membrane protein insertase YidC [Pseudomonadota bacterium]